MSVSDRDREYMRRLGEFQSEGHAEALRAHLALPVAARLAASLALAKRFAPSMTPAPDDPSPFYERARRLGLYRP